MLVIQVRSMRASAPLFRIAPIAWFTHVTRRLPFCSTIPKCSPVVAANWPRTIECGTCTAVT